MRNWTAIEIKNLRKRLGWSVADFSRRFGCKSETILEWEKGAASPFPAHARQLESLDSSLKKYSNQIKLGAQAEQLIGDNGLAQIHSDDVHLSYEK